MVVKYFGNPGNSSKGKKATELSNIDEIHEEARQKRLAQELPGFNWLEDKIKSGQLNRPPPLTRKLSFDQSEVSQNRKQKSESVYQSSLRRKTIDSGESYQSAGIRYGPISGRNILNSHCIAMATSKAASTNSLQGNPRSSPVRHLMNLPPNPYYPCSVGDPVVRVPTTTVCSFSMSNSIPRVNTIPAHTPQCFPDMNCAPSFRPMNPFLLSNVVESRPTSSNNNFICARIKRTVPILSQASSTPLIAPSIQSKPVSVEKVTVMHVPVISTPESFNPLTSSSYYLNSENEITNSDIIQSNNSHRMTNNTLTFQELGNSAATNTSNLFLVDVHSSQNGASKIPFSTCNAVNLSTAVKKHSQPTLSPSHLKHNNNNIEIAIIDSDDDNEASQKATEKNSQASEAEAGKSSQTSTETIQNTGRPKSVDTEVIILPDSSQMSPVIAETETDVRKSDLSKKENLEGNKVTEFIDLVDDIIGLDELPNGTLDDWDGGSMEVLNLSMNKNKNSVTDEIRSKNYSEIPVSLSSSLVNSSDSVSRENRRSTIMRNPSSLEKEGCESELINLSTKSSVPSRALPKSIQNAPVIVPQPLSYYCNNTENFPSVHCDESILTKLPNFYSENTVPKAVATSKVPRGFHRPSLHSSKTDLGSLQLELDRRKKELDFLERLANDHQIEQERLRIAMREKEELLLKIEQLRQESSKKQMQNVAFVKGNQLLASAPQNIVKPAQNTFESEFLVRDMRKRKSSSPSYCSLAEKQPVLNSPPATAGSTSKVNPVSVSSTSGKVSTSVDAKENAQDSILSSLLVSSSAVPLLGFPSRSHSQLEKRIVQWPEQKSNPVSSTVSSCFTCDAIMENTGYHKRGCLLDKTSNDFSLPSSNRTAHNNLNPAVNAEPSYTSEVSNSRRINSSVPMGNSVPYYHPGNPPLKYSQTSMSSSGTSAFSKPTSCNGPFPHQVHAPRMPTLPYHTSVGSYESQWGMIGNPTTPNAVSYQPQQFRYQLGLMHPNLPHGHHPRMVSLTDHSTTFRPHLSHNVTSAFTTTRSPRVSDYHHSQLNKQNDSVAKPKRNQNPSQSKNVTVLPRCYNRSNNCIRPVQFVCSSCTSAWYCSLECQMQDWPRHCNTCIK